MRKPLLVFWLFFSSIAIAQPLQWGIRVGGSTANPNPGVDERITSVKTDDAGNIYICGNVYQGFSNVNGYPLTINGNADIFVAKLDCNANVIWARTAGGLYSEDALSLELDNEGHLYLAGQLNASFINKWMFFDTLIGDSSISSWYLAKFDTSGNYIGGRMAQENNHISYFYKMMLNNSGDPTLLLGTYGSEILPGLTVDTGIYVLTLDTAGILKNIFEVNPSYSYITPFGMGMDSESNYYFTSYWWGDSVNFNGTVYYSNHPGSSYQNNYYLYSCDSTGYFRWVKQFTDTLSSENLSSGRALLIDSLDNIYVAGMAYSGLNADGYIFNNPPGWIFYQGFLIKYDNMGNQLWARTIANQMQGSPTKGLAFKPNGNVLVSHCYSVKALIGSDTITSPSGTSGNILLAEFTPSGTPVWHDKLDGNQSKEVWSLATDIHDNIYMGGAFRNSLFIGPQILTKIGGNSDGFVARWGTTCVTGSGEELQARNGALQMFPNPTSANATVQWPENFQPRMLRLMNLTGQVMYSANIPAATYSYQLSFSGYPAGIYLTEVTGTDGQALRTRVVLVK